MTERLATRIKDKVNAIRGYGITLRAFSVPDRGRASLESQLGADLAGVLNVTAPGHKSRKLFLAQAKIAEDGMVLRRDLARLVQQCHDMLEITDDSIVALYSGRGVDVVRTRDMHQAASEQIRRGSGGLDTRNQLYRKPFDAYMGEVYMTWHGDEKLGPEVHSLGELEDLVTRMRARQGLAIICEARGGSRAQAQLF